MGGIQLVPVPWLELALWDALSNCMSQIRDLKMYVCVSCLSLEAKLYKAYGTRWVDHCMKLVQNFVGKFRLCLAHFENIIADTTKLTDKTIIKNAKKWTRQIFCSFLSFL